MADRATVNRMYDQYRAGATLAEVGEKHGMTREAIRQNFLRAGLPTISLADRKQRLYERVTSHVLEMHKSGFDDAQIGVALELPTSAVTQIIRTHLPRRNRRPKRPYSKRYDTPELIAMLQEVSVAIGGVVTTKVFNEYGAHRVMPDGRRWPTSQTTVKRFGSWRSALHAAGLLANPSSPIAGQVLFDRGQCLDAVRHVARQVGEVPTAAEYDRHARGSQGGLPSLATVRTRMGSWQNAIDSV